MYTATMHYQFKPDRFDQACEIWKNEVIEHAKTQPGFIRMQFLVSGNEALAVGTWENRDNANKFMETGVFRRLMEKLEDMVTTKPKPTVWDLKYFEEG